jgi:NAD(P)-dependent dehydrogenase (short-subunit alcohol dehydrogenase family)
MSEFPEGAALVVGASGGVGRAIALALAGRGSDVALTYHANRAGAEEAAMAIRALGRGASVHHVDLRELEAVRALMDAVVATHARLHTVVHAAGSSIDQPYFNQVDPAAWRAVIDADVNGSFHVAHTALPHLKAGGGGSFVFVSSAGLKRFPPGDVLSVAPKAAVEALFKAIAREEGRFGVRANSVLLGIIDAGMFHRLVAKGELDEDYLAAARRNIALRRFGSAEEVADAVCFLASSRASYITGQELLLDGGYTI